jgi:hypothetical protein
MQSDDTFCEMINSIQFLNMSKAGSHEGMHANFNDSGFNSGAEMNTDNIFFYEDSCPSLSSINMVNNDEAGNMMTSKETCDHQLPSPGYEGASSSRRSENKNELTQIQINVGIDEDLKMILEMDPSLMDETLDKAVEPLTTVVECPKILGLPPKM